MIKSLYDIHDIHACLWESYLSVPGFILYGFLLVPHIVSSEFNKLATKSSIHLFARLSTRRTFLLFCIYFIGGFCCSKTCRWIFWILQISVEYVSGHIKLLQFLIPQSTCYHPQASQSGSARWQTFWWLSSSRSACFSNISSSGQPLEGLPSPSSPQSDKCLAY